MKKLLFLLLIPIFSVSCKKVLNNPDDPFIVRDISYQKKSKSLLLSSGKTYDPILVHASTDIRYGDTLYIITQRDLCK